MQHGVAKSRWRELRQVLQVGELAAGLWRTEVIGDAHGQLLVLPQPEHRLVVRRIHADAAAIDDAGDAEAVHLAEESPGAVDLLLHGRLGQLVKNLAECTAAGVDDAGRLVVAIARELAAGRHIVVVADVQRLHRLRRQQQPVIEMLDVDGIVGRSRGDLRRCRPALLGKLLLGPAAGDDDPGSGLLRLCSLTDFLQRVFQRGHADPVHLGAEGQRGADAVDVAVGEPWNHGAAAEVDQFCTSAGELPHRCGGTGGEDFAVGNRHRLLRGEVLVDGQDPAVEENRIGGLGRRDAHR